MSDLDDLLSEIDSAMEKSPQKKSKVQGNSYFPNDSNNNNPSSTTTTTLSAGGNRDASGENGWSDGTGGIKAKSPSAGSSKMRGENLHDLLRDVEDVMNDFDIEDPSTAATTSTTAASRAELLKYTEAASTSSSTSAAALPRSGASGGPKCVKLIIGGMSLKPGRTTSSMKPASCDRMQCTKCDLPVYRYEKCIWDSSVDYLFFRNNFSRKDRLSAKMIPDPEYVSYACQCTWISVKDVHLVDKDPDLNWRCAGHDDQGDDSGSFQTSLPPDHLK